MISADLMHRVLFPLRRVANLFQFTEYTGTGASQDVVTEQDLAGQGGMVLIKSLDDNRNWNLYDTVRGAGKFLRTNGTDAEITFGAQDFNTDGFATGAYVETAGSAGEDMAAFSWLIEEGFFDVVTFTGNGSARTIAHSLGVAPTMMWLMNRAGSQNKIVYHKDNTAAPETDGIRLNDSIATQDVLGYWNDTAPTASVFTVGTAAEVNNSGDAIVAYLFADKAGVSKSGSYVGVNGGLSVTGLGFRPRVVLIKCSNNTGNWKLVYEDGATGDRKHLSLNATTVATTLNLITLDSDGFTFNFVGGVTDFCSSGREYIYYAWA